MAGGAASREVGEASSVQTERGVALRRQAAAGQPAARASQPSRTVIGMRVPRFSTATRPFDHNRAHGPHSAEQCTHLLEVFLRTAPASAKSARANERVTYLDALRGLAATSVVIGHYFAAYGNPPGLPAFVMNSPFAVICDGFAAVSFFFVLSGFVLSMRYFRDPDFLRTRFSYGEYAVARIFRIWGPFAVVFLLSFAVHEYWSVAASSPGTMSAWLAGFWREQLTFRQALTELSLVLPPQIHQTLPQAWTLSIELSLSLFIPVAVMIALRRLRWLVAVVAYLIVVMGASRYLFHFMLGICLCSVWVTRRHWIESIPATGRLAGWIAAAILYSYRFSVVPYAPHALPEQRIWYVTGVGSLMILALVLVSPRLQAVLLFRPLRHLGQCAYSIYLVHFTILLAASPRVMQFLIDRLHVPSTPAWAAGLVFLLAATFGVSHVSERWLERPCIAAGKWVAAKL